MFHLKDGIKTHSYAYNSLPVGILFRLPFLFNNKSKPSQILEMQKKIKIEN